jgi:hypothetical protein
VQWHQPELAAFAVQLQPPVLEVDLCPDKRCDLAETQTGERRRPWISSCNFRPGRDPVSVACGALNT